jgi:tRNA-dihydrouridine synthase B
MARPLRALPAALSSALPLTALAPMQYITDAAFMRVVTRFGAPDYFFTEYFRVHEHSRLEKHILEAIVENRTERPVFAQLIGEDIEHLCRTARELGQYPIAGVDLNLGCPAPFIYKKNVGGGLLRDIAQLDRILGALRDAIPGRFTVKMRIGFDSSVGLCERLALLDRHDVDLLSLHGRTVKEMYRSHVHYDCIQAAVAQVRCPVLANGEVSSAAKALRVLHETGAAGVMIGRHAIRNPWIFAQCRAAFEGSAPPLVTLSDVREYVELLYEATLASDASEHAHVTKLKKYLNFVGLGVDEGGRFLHAMRRAEDKATLFSVCDRFLLADPKRPFAAEPFPGLVARPRCELDAGHTAAAASLAEPHLT